MNPRNLHRRSVGAVLALAALVAPWAGSATQVAIASVKTEAGYVQALKRAGDARRHLAARDSAAWLATVRDMSAVRGVVLSTGDTVASDLLWIASATLRGFEEDNSDLEAALRMHGETDAGERLSLLELQARAALELEDLRQAGLFRAADPPEPPLFSLFDRLSDWLDRKLSSRQGADAPQEPGDLSPDMVDHVRTALLILLLGYLLWPILRSIRVIRRDKRRRSEANSTAKGTPADLYARARAAEDEQRWAEAAKLYTAWLLGKLTRDDGRLAASGATLREQAAGVTDAATRRDVSELLLGYEFFVYGGKRRAPRTSPACVSQPRP